VTHQPRFTSYNIIIAYRRSVPNSRLVQYTFLPVPDLQNALLQYYDYLTIMPKLRSTFDGRLIFKTIENILRRTQSFSYIRLTCTIAMSSEIVLVNLVNLVNLQ